MHYEWEHGKGKYKDKPKDSTVTDAMTKANDEEDAKTTHKVEITKK